MAFDLLPGNLTQTSVIGDSAGLVAGADNFITTYTLADKYEKALIPMLHMAHGRGKILQFLKIIGAESTYASDAIQHAEEGRLQTMATNVTFSGSTFTSPTDHQLSVGDIVKMSDGVAETQATVTSITSSKIFVASNDLAANFSGLTSPVTVLCDFSNSYDKGSDDATVGKRWEPTIYSNYTHILKKVYNVSGSDMVHNTWIQTPDGPRWYNHEVENSNILFDNLEEYTQIFYTRKTTSSTAPGVMGVLQQIENRGNIGNQYITDIEELSEIAYRIKQQGTCREFTIWHNHKQGAYLRQMIAGVNAHYAAGANYGQFNNSKDTAMKLGFNSVYIDGVTFHFTPWNILDDPQMFGAADFKVTSLAALIIPSGTEVVNENGNHVSRPYLSVRYRADAMQNRKREIKLFGPGGTPHKKDIQTTHFMSEFTNQLVGANQYFAIRGSAGFYTNA